MDRAKDPDPDAELAAAVKDIMIGVLDLGVDRSRLDDSVSLYSPSVGLDSLSLLHILVQVEGRFGIEIDDEDVMAAELSDVGSLVEMIRRAVDGNRVGE
ncbi:acyl carrier protein [Actinomadura gamaensis]|uniref:Acyl carrier protein n=1 Tax=Actinomadura gamaensis TaxID=1763541 RepID=A0ABV9U070_9ACTN